MNRPLLTKEARRTLSRAGIATSALAMGIPVAVFLRWLALDPLFRPIASVAFALFFAFLLGLGGRYLLFVLMGALRHG